MRKKTNFRWCLGLLMLFSPLIASADFSDPNGVAYTDPGGFESSGNGIVVDTFTAGAPYIYVAGNRGQGAGSDWLAVKYDGGGVIAASATVVFSGEEDTARAVALDRQGNPVAAGYAENSGIARTLVVKYKPDLTILSSATFETPTGNRAHAVAIDKDNNIIVAGSIGMTDSEDFLVLKYTSDLVFVSSATVSMGATADSAYGVAVGIGNDIFVTGKSMNQMVTMKFTSALAMMGAPVFFNGWGNAAGYAVAAGFGAVYVAGRTSSVSPSDGYVMLKYDSNLASVISSATYDFGGNEDEARGIFVDRSGDVYVAGRATNGGSFANYGTLQLNANLGFLASQQAAGDRALDGAFAIAGGTGTYLYVTGRLKNNLCTIRYSTGSFIADTVPPAAVTDLAVSNSMDDYGIQSLLLTWTSPGDDGWSGPLKTGSQFIVKYSTFSSNILNIPVVVSTSGVTPGEKVSYRFPLTAMNQIYYFRLAYRDGQGNMSGDSNLATLLAESSAGKPERVTFETGGITVQRGQPAGSPVRLLLVDNRGMITTSTSTVTVYLAGKTKYFNYSTGWYEYPDDLTAAFSATAGFTSLITSVTIPAGASGTEFYFKTSTAPIAIIQLSYTLTAPHIEEMPVTVINGGIVGARIHKGDYANNTTISLDAEETAFIDFGLDDPGIDWQVIISTSTDMSCPVWTYSGYGIPWSRQVSWNGRVSYYDPVLRYWRDEKAPRGTYHVRIQLGNMAGIYDDSLSIVIQSMEITGRVTDSLGDGLPGVYVTGYGPSYSYTYTDSSGYYKLSGLRSGSYMLDYSRSGYTSVSVSEANAGETRDIVLQQPAYIKINARRALNDTIDDPELWGNFQLYSVTDAQTVYYGSLHFNVNVSTSDNDLYADDTAIPRYEVDNSTGNRYGGGKWVMLQVTPGVYAFSGELPGYDPVEKTGIVVSTGDVREISDIFFSFRKNVFGVVELADTPADSWGTWVSIEAVPEGSAWGTAWGWTSIPQGSSSGTYSIYGLSAGNYVLRAFAPGYRKTTVPLTIAAGDTTVAASTITLSTGGGLTGTVTVEGDTTDPSLNLYSDGMDQSRFTVNLNAWSPNSYSYGWAQVSLSKNATLASSTFTIRGLDDGTYWINSWLSGFDLEGAQGWSGVKATISGGSGTLNLKFRQHSGRIKCTFRVPYNDYEKLLVSINGMSVWINEITFSSMSSYGIQFDSATGVMLSPPLGTGFYEIKGEYTGTGMTKSRQVMAVSGQPPRETEIDLSAPTYSVAGRVRISQSNPPQGYTDMSVLVATVPQIMVADYGNYAPNMVWLGGQSTTSFRVTAADYTKLSTITGAATGPDGRSGIIGNDGSFVITGLVPGIYILKIPALELNGIWNDGRETSPAEERTIIVDRNITVDTLEVAKGFSVKGQVKLPSGETATREMWVNIFNAADFKVSNFKGSGSWTSYVGSTKVNFVNSNAANYEFKGLKSGQYVIAVQDWYGGVARQYANASLNVTVESSDLNGQNIQLGKGGKITFKLRDADSGTIITPRNKDKMLPQSFVMSAIANPWVEGGWSSIQITAPSTGTAAGQDSFEFSFLPEASYDVLLGQSSYGFYASLDSSGQGNNAGNQTNYAAKTIAGVAITNGQTKDLGTIDIKQGLTVTGTVKDKNGNGIPNLPVLAIPSLSREWSSELRGFTDVNGRYSIVGLNPDYPYYDIIACPRIDPRLLGGYFFFGAGGITYGESVRSMVKIQEASPVDFVLRAANGAVKGKVVTEDNGVLRNPDDLNLPTAKVFLQLEDTFPRTNPIGDIVAATEVDGTFALHTLVPGTYRLVIVSGGYASYSRSVTVADGEVNLGTLQLKKGARVSGSIAKVDGKNPSTSEVRSITAATDDLGEILIGSLKISGEKTVTGYELNGFQAGGSYDIMFISEDDELIPAAVDYRVPFSTYVKTDNNVIFRVAAPAVFSRAKRDGNRYTVYLDLTGALRKSLPGDDNLNQIITLAAGAGTISDRYIAPHRKSLSCVYTAPAGETRFTLRLQAFAKTVNPETGTEFAVDESFQYYAGIGAKNRVKVSNLRGGKVTLEGDSSAIQFGPGTFNVSSSTSAVYVDFSRAESLSDLVSAAPGRAAPRLVIRRAPQAYPERLSRALQLAQAAEISPLSSFYDVMLPQGVSRTLKKDASLTLQFAGGTDPTTLNVYYFDEVNNVYLLENRNRQIDATANTVSVSVNHASVFVVLRSNAAVIQGTSYNGPLFVYNYPNPFNLTAKSVTLSNAPAGQETQTVGGTMLHYGLPQDLSGEVEIKIYTVTGELVRTIRDGLRTGGSHYYTGWDGTNEDGRQVASGVYIGRFTVDNKQEKFFKMAVIK